MLDGYGRAVVQFFSDEKVVSKPELTSKCMQMFGNLYSTVSCDCILIVLCYCIASASSVIGASTWRHRELVQISQRSYKSMSL